MRPELLAAALSLVRALSGSAESDSGPQIVPSDAGRNVPISTPMPDRSGETSLKVDPRSGLAPLKDAAAIVPSTLTPSPPAPTPTRSLGPTPTFSLGSTREGEGPAPTLTPTRRSRLDAMEGAHLGGGPCGGSLATLGGAVGIAAILARRRGNEAK